MGIEKVGELGEAGVWHVLREELLVAQRVVQLVSLSTHSLLACMG